MASAPPCEACQGGRASPFSTRGVGVRIKEPDPSPACLLRGCCRGSEKAGHSLKLPSHQCELHVCRSRDARSGSGLVLGGTSDDSFAWSVK